MILPVIDKDVLIFDVNIIKKLRDLGIIGKFLGSLPQAPQQNNFLGLPLQLSPYEVLWLVESGNAIIVDGTKLPTPQINSPERHKTTQTKQGPYYVTPKGYEPHQLSGLEVDLNRFWDQINIKDYRIFKYLKQQGYWILPGLKFGGKFLAYPGDPMMFHSHLIVKSGNIGFNELVVSGRLATGVKKLFVISDIEEDVGEEEEEEQCKGKIFSIEWAGIG